jgi:hypothetical protein
MEAPVQQTPTSSQLHRRISTIIDLQIRSQLPLAQIQD